MRFSENRSQVFLILLGISLLLFFPILNNEFWTVEEYEYLEKSLDLSGSEEVYHTTGDAHRLVNFFHRIEYQLFGDIPTGYYLLNIVLHAINAFLLYLLILMTLRDSGISLLAAVLFVFAVGNYGKEVMYAAGVSALLMKTIFLGTVMAYISNEIHSRGKVLSLRYLLTLVLFAVAMVNLFASLSIMGIVFFYNLFFRKERERRLFSPPLILLFALGLAITLFQLPDYLRFTSSYPEGWGLGFFFGNFFVNIPRFLIHMVFPMHITGLVQEGGLVEMVFQLRFWIRPLLGFIIFSYAVYGFVFGNKNLRFFIAWTFISILPVCLRYFPGDWLDIKFLYLASAGFCLILATGTMKMFRVLRGRGWRMFLPFLIPLMFSMLSVGIVYQLDRAYEERARTPQIRAMKFQYLKMKREAIKAKEAIE
jgi:hypothetical protein